MSKLETLPGAITGPKQSTVFEPGTAVDHYRVIRLIGRGGFGDVYLARDTTLGRRVALKIVRPDNLGSSDAVKRFLYEARATARFSHPHIVSIYSVGESRGMPYVALEYLEGRTLRQRIDEGTVGMREALRICHAIGLALQEAHRRKVLHRDLKPENILLPKDGRLRVVDFGLARKLSSDRDGGPSTIRRGLPTLSEVADGPDTPNDGASSRTQHRPPADGQPGTLPTTLNSEDQLADDLLAGQPTADAMADTLKSDVDLGLLTGVADTATLAHVSLSQYSAAPGGIQGTPAYMAPEQWYGDAGSTATDLWALGVIMFELFAGFRPFDAKTPLKQAHLVCGVEPTPPLAAPAGELPGELVELVQRCLTKDPGGRAEVNEVVETLERLLRVLPSRLSEDQGPFRGLLPFDEQHAELYFGRDLESGAAAERLRVESSLAIVGASGAGKSSFVCAGLLPRLREQSRCVTLLVRPGKRPFETLAACLRRQMMTRSGIEADALDVDGLAQSMRDAPTRLGLLLRDMAEDQRARVILVVDQLEELHTHVASTATRERFLQALETAAEDPREPVRVIVTLRDDFLGKLALGDLGTQLLGRVMVLRTPRTSDLERILEQPAAAFGYRFEDGLATDMVDAVSGVHAALPLLQFAAQMLWDRRDREQHLLTRATYEQMGGVVGALATHGDTVLEALSAEQVDVTRQLFSRLVTQEGTRRVVTRAKLLDGLSEGASHVLDRLIGSRLITTRRGDEQGELEIAHESLIGCWTRLSRWLDENREERIVAAELEQAAESWGRKGERDEQLWRGESLHDALRIAANPSTELSALAGRFVEKSATLQRQQQQKARLRRLQLRVLAGGVGIALLAILLAWNLTIRAKEREARRQQRAATSRASQTLLESAKLSRLAGRYFEARAKLRAALEIGSPPGATTEWWQLHNEPLLWNMPASQSIASESFSPDGKKLAFAFRKGPTIVFDVRQRLPLTVAKQNLGVTAVTFAPDGRSLALGTADGRVFLFDLIARKRVLVGSHPPVGSAGRKRDKPRPQQVSGLAFEQGGRLISATNHEIRRHVLAGSKQSESIALAGLQFQHVGRAADGSVVLAYTGAHSIQLFLGLTRWKRFDGLFIAPFAVVVNHDRSRLFFAHLAATASVRRLDLAQKEDTLFARHVADFPVSAPFSAAAYSPDGRYLAVATQRGISLLDARSHRALALLRSHDRDATGRETWPRSLRFSPDSKLLLATRWAGSAQLWWVDRFLQRYRATGGKVGNVQVDAGRDTVATLTHRGRVNLWSARSGAFIRTLGHRDASALSYSHDGSRLAIGDTHGNVRIFDQLGTPLGTLRSAHRGGTMAVAFSWDDIHVVSAGRDKQIAFGSIHGGTPTRRLQTALTPGSIAIDRKNRMVAVGRFARKSRSGEFPLGAEVLALNDGRRLWATHSMIGNVAVAFSWDGRRLLTAAHPPGIFRTFALGAPRSVPATFGRSMFVLPGGIRGVPVDGGPACRTCSAYLQRKEPPFRARLFSAGSVISSLSWRHRRGFAVTAAYSGPEGWVDGRPTPIWRASLLHGARLYRARGVLDLTTQRPVPTPALARWERAVVKARLADVDSEGRLVCMQHFDGDLALWDIRQDRRLFRKAAWVAKPPANAAGHVALELGTGYTARPAREIQFMHGNQLLSQGGRCLLLVSPWLFAIDTNARAKQIVLPRNVSGTGYINHLGRAGHLLLIVTKEVALLDERDNVLATFVGPVWPTAATATREYVAIGDRDGRVHFKHVSEATLKSLAPRGRAPVSEVAILRDRFLVAGYTNGLVRLWLLPDLLHALDVSLTGIARYVSAHQRRAYLADHRGDWLRIDLRGFRRDRCELLRQLRTEVGVVWQGQGLVEAPAPTRCKSSP